MRMGCESFDSIRNHGEVAKYGAESELGLTTRTKGPEHGMECDSSSFQEQTQLMSGSVCVCVRVRACVCVCVHESRRFA